MISPLILNRQREQSIPLDRLKEFACLLSQRLGIHDSEFTVLLTSDREIRRFNREFRKKDQATNVLSFPVQRNSNLDFGNNYLGDIIISVGTARQQALHKQHSLETEIRILMIHGLLHLMGYDHETDQGQMRRKELKLHKEFL